jgi:hypothetical protein
MAMNFKKTADVFGSVKPEDIEQLEPSPDLTKLKP